MEEKHKDLKSNKQLRVIEQIMLELADAHPSFYYLSTIEISNEISAYIKSSNRLNKQDLELVDSLSARDIQMLLSLHHK